MARVRDIIDIEMWRDVPGYDGTYEVSSHGRIRRWPRIVATKGGGIRLQEYALLRGRSPKHVRGRYAELALIDERGKQRRKTVHWLVCRAFHGPQPTPEHQAAHNDGNPANNRADNLRWATPKENAADRVRHGTERMGEDIHHRAKLTAQDVKTIREEYRPGYGHLVPLARKYGVTTAAICAVVKRKNWKHV